MKNEICGRCPHGRNVINGRWCTCLGRSVEYAAEPPCRDSGSGAAAAQDEAAGGGASAAGEGFAGWMVSAVRVAVLAVLLGAGVVAVMAMPQDGAEGWLWVMAVWKAAGGGALVVFDRLYGHWATTDAAIGRWEEWNRRRE